MSLRPYQAIIADSFRSALSSRVLWIAMVAIWLFLILLSPFGYREDYTTEFRNQDFHNGTRLKGMLASGLVDPDVREEPLGLIASAVPEDLQRQLRLVGKGDEVRIRYSVLTDALNGLIEDESWYNAQSWQSTTRLRELRELDEQDVEQLSDSLRKRRARLRIEAALPGVFEARASRSILLTYAGLDFPTEVTVDKPQFKMLVNQFVLPLIINWLLGFILIFLGILVTASIIPDMLQPGSLHLLLSKPVSRTLLLLSKFVGGCAFVLLCVTQLVIGLYLIAGLRLDIWNLRLLWCIPVSVFLFSVFYSVSVLAGLRWRSPILAIGVTVIFGGICMLVGFIGGLSDGLVTGPDRLSHLAVAGDDIFATTKGGGMVRFDASQNQWSEIYESGPGNRDRVLAPLAISSDQIITARVRGGRMNPFGSGAPELSLLSRKNDWSPEPSLRLPTGTTQLLAPKKIAPANDSIFALNTSDLLTTTRSEILLAAGEQKEDAPTPESDASQNTPSWFSKLNSLIGGKTKGFENITPERMPLTQPRSVAVVNANTVVAISGGRLMRVEKAPTDRWTIAKQRTLAGDNSLDTLLAVTGDQLMLARPDEPLRIIDLESLQDLAELEMPTRSFATQLVGFSNANGDDTFLVVLSDGTCRQVNWKDDSKKRLNDFARIGPNEIETLSFDQPANRLFFAHNVDQLDAIDVSTGDTVLSIRPSVTGWRQVDQLVVTPLRWLTPQTGDLGETIATMISGKSAFSFSSGDGERETIRRKVAGPVISCTVFTTVMLMISCVYFATRDF
ncbi:ABC-2 family transporter protein [Rubripirellula obstinata]|uniref:ABC-2 family transporter protein n=1 Tax=Rubripirellula obstinata TaxID=406547 RepID=A0A5B1CKX5_9BACT|nr:ABC transporter permease [Rubripirellula obstinata]KAA1260043.1 ABC-2 family transporter protein [Rubripirellula obstinata]